MAVTVRSATEEDVPALTRLLDLPERAVMRVLHERSTHVATTDEEPIAGLAYDLWNDTVHITHLGGEADGIAAVLSEAQETAARRGLAVEAIVPIDDEPTVTAIEGAGFDDVGHGPAFRGEATRRYRLPSPGT